MSGEAEHELRPARVRPVMLVSTRIPTPDPEKEQRNEQPRDSLFNRTLGTVVINEAYLAKMPPGWRRMIYRHLPTFAAQVLETYIVKKRFDVILSWSDQNGLLMGLLLKLTHSRFPHVAMMYWPSKPKKANLLKMVHPYISTLCLWTSTHRDLATSRLGIPPEKIKMIPQFVDTQFFKPVKCETDTICAVGQEMRDYPTLIEAMKGLSIKCHLATGSTPGGKIHKTVKFAYEPQIAMPPNVTVGAMPPAKLRDLYARSRFVVIPLLPTDSDNGTRVITEAMAMGKAVICSLTKGQRDVIIEGKTGIYVPQGDPKALREAIQRLWDHPEIADEMGRAGRKYVEENLTWEHFVETVRDIVEEAAERGKKGRK